MKVFSFLSLVLLFSIVLSCQKEEIETTQQDTPASDYTKPDFLTKAPIHSIDIQKFGNIYYLNPSVNQWDDNTADFQAEINKMSPNDLLILKAGVHYLNGIVGIHTPHLTIYGEPGSVIRKIGGKAPCIFIHEPAHYTQVDNIHIDGAKIGDPGMIVHSNHNYIVNSKFNNCGGNGPLGNPSGLLLHGSHLNVIEGCQFYGNYMVGLSQWESGSNEIKYCQMELNGAEGITVDGHSHNVRIHHNWIHKNCLPPRGVGGIGIDASNGTQIYDNTIDFNGVAGIKFQNNLCGGCDGATIYNNQNISYNQGPGIAKRYNGQPITHLGIWGNTMVGNWGGNVGVDHSTAPCQPM